MTIPTRRYDEGSLRAAVDELSNLAEEARRVRDLTQEAATRWHGSPVGDVLERYAWELDAFVGRLGGDERELVFGEEEERGVMAELGFHVLTEEDFRSLLPE